jgi:amino acid adenylation domain-containing protein
VRLRPDGRLDLLGRTDQQVKIRGFRIELGEIEAALAAHPAVAQAAVVVREQGERCLVAWVAKRPGADLSGPSLRAYLGERLPELMVPPFFAVVEELPLNTNGKIDRGALSRRAPNPLEPASKPAAPGTPIEEVLAGIWAEVLGLESPGRDAGFFELGGHSLLATRAVSRVRSAFGIELGVRTLFENPTPARLAPRIEAALRAAGAVSPAPPIGRLPRDPSAPVPLSFAQRRLWFLEQLDPGGSAYTIAAAVRLAGRLHAEALAAALGEVVRRHEALRTTFGTEAGHAGEPMQRIVPYAPCAGLPPLAVPLIDLTALSPDLRQAEARRLAVSAARRPFSLEHGPLVRFALLRLGEEEHALLVTLHHIVADGWSLGVLVRELAALYPELAARRPSPLPPLPVQYADFTLWQHDWLRGEPLEAQLRHWRERLAGVSSEPVLLPDRPHLPNQRRAGSAALSSRLPAGLAASLSTLGRREGATLFMVLLAGWKAILFRTSGQTDVAVGSPVANRRWPEIEGLIGFFVNTLVLRTSLRPDAGAGLAFSGLLSRVREVALAAYAHQDLPFERLVEEMAPDRSAGRSPLFQVVFALQNNASGPLALPGLELSPLPELADGLTAPKFDLTLAVIERGPELEMSLEIDRGLFDVTTAARLLAHFAAFLASAAADPAGCLDELPFLSAAERSQLLVEWRGAVRDGRDQITIPSLFAAWVRQSPSAPALDFDGESLTYAELDLRANRLAWRLLRLGVRPEDRVGLAVRQSAGMVVGMLAILKAGGAYVPLDPGYPAERLEWMAADAELTALIASGSRPAAPGIPVIRLDELDEEDGGVLAVESAEDPWTGGSADRLAYVMYTSGSTGVPKGVAIPHRGIVRLVLDPEYVSLGPGDRLAQVSNVSFDGATYEIWGALLSGARLVGIPREVLLSPGALAGALAEREVTALVLTTALFQQTARQQPGAFRGLRHLLFGGEAADPRAVGEALRTGPPGRLVHLYGPTESTTFATWQRVAEVAAGEATLPIGHPVQDTEVFVAGPGLSLAPPGAPGELLIGGGGLARGYWRRPDLTAERFMPNPWSARPGDRLYRTGDRVRRRGDGAIEFLGRFDQQVKIRGFRIEPEEVEAGVARCPGVRAAAVLVREDHPGERRLVAYVVPEGATPPSVRELRELLADRLPEPMLPSAVVALPALPLTPNGKVDRRALAALGPETARAAGAAPRTPAEDLLTGIWAELLGVEQVGVDDNFFDLGGHSLLATRVMSRLREVFGVELPLSCLFEGPRVSDLAAAVERARAAAPPVAIPPLVAGSVAGPPPLSFAQQRLWFLDQLDPGSAAYNIPVGLRLRGRLDVAALSLALREVVRRHEVLRTTFETREGEPVQIIAPNARTFLPVVDLRGLAEAVRAREVSRLAQEEARAPFDLGRGPLLRQSLLALDCEEHAALVTMHHIVSDGWSTGVLVRELRTLYAAFLAGRPSPLPELPVQYADFAVWQRRWLTGEVLQAELEHWRGHLGQTPSTPELPVDRPRPAVRTWRGGRRGLLLPAGLAASLQKLARRSGATLFMTLLAAWKALCQRSTGQSEMIVGTPIAGRTHAATEGLIGLFVNTLVLRTGLEGDPGFTELLGRVREVTLEAYAHQGLPFEKLVEELRPERRLSQSALFQVMFALQNAPRERLELSGVELVPLESDSGVAKFDLTLTLGEEEGRLGGVLVYAAELFDAATAERLLSHYKEILSGIVAEPAARLSELPLLGSAERHQLLVEWNDTRQTLAEPEACVHQLFEAQVKRSPEAVAVACEGETLSYGEVDLQANRLAYRLRRMGVGPETRVVLWGRRSPAMIVGMLGILKAGGAYVPIDADVPRERLVAILQDLAREGAPVIVVAQEAVAERLSDPNVRLVRLEEVLGTEPGRQVASSLSGVGAANAAYLIYTSGSTGEPKAVEVEHRQLVNYLSGVVAQLGLGPGSGYALMQPLSVDACKTAVYPPLLTGGTLHIISEERALDGPRLAEYLGRHEMDVLKLAPSHLIALQSSVPEDGLLPREWLLLGGEASRRDWILGLRAKGRCRILNQYGPTETTVAVLACRIEPDLADGPSQSAPLGRPQPNTRVYVLDAAQRSVPVGIAGEIAIGGAGVARGYFGRPAFTAEKFVPDGFAGVAEAGSRLYRTGDLARFLANGDLEFLGRIDHQIKIRGFRVELGEIEASLYRHPEVQEAVVAGWEGRPGEVQLVAYLTARREPPPAPEQLRGFLKERLPAHMVPSSFVVLESLPRTAHGKADRKALARIGPAPVSTTYTAPRTPVEELLAGIWSHLLQVERVGVHDNFFDLGGHSLLATRVVSRVRESFGVELPLSSLFEAPRLADLAVAVERARAAAPLVEALPLVARSEAGPPPLSFAQQRLWFLDQLEPSRAAYNIPFGLRLRGRLEVAVLSRVLSEVVRRHEALRTTFETVDGEPVQIIAPVEPVLLPVVDVQALPAAVREIESVRLGREEARTPFDLSRGPLLRQLLLAVDRDEHVVLVTMHHIISDGWSTGVLVREIRELYAAFLARCASPLPALPVQYADFAVWQQRWMQGKASQGQLRYWREALAGAPASLGLPTDRPRSALASGRGGVCEVLLDRGLTASLHALGRRAEATLFMTLLAAFTALLCRYTGQEDLLVGTPVANRNRREIEDLIGLFVNTLVLRSDVSGDPSFLDLARRIRSGALAAYAHQDLPFDKLVAELSPERSLLHTPLFQVMLSVQNAPVSALELPGLRLSVLDLAAASSKFDLSLTLVEKGDGMTARLDFRRDLFDAATTKRLLGHFLALLGGVAASPDRRIADLPVWSESERHHVLQEWNATGEALPLDVCLHELFESQAARSPSAVAVVLEGETLTYGELDALVSRMARGLRRRGVRAEVVVGLLAERSFEMVVGLLAILRAGGAYLPLDPSYPAERLSFMVADSRAPLVLAQEHFCERLESLKWGGVELLPLGTGGEVSWGEDDYRLVSGVTPANLAYVIYTSGSTGRPKGVMVPHRGVCNRLLWSQGVYGLGPRDAVLQKASFSFDFAVWECFAPLLSGARLVLARPEGQRDSAYLVQAIAEQEITFVHFVPSMLGVFLAAEGVERCRSLRQVFSGGESLRSELRDRFFTRLDIPLDNQYGPTEISIDATLWVCRPDQKPQRVPIGRPIGNMRLFVVDQRFGVAPIGVPGELLVGGPGVVRGYQGRPDLTAERFIPDAWSGAPGERLYRTGDLVRWLPDGVLEFLGRLDNQVKVRGYRIEIGEIEAALAAQPGVRQAAAAVHGEGDVERHLVSYLVMEPGTSPDIAGLRRALAARLPDYMTPAVFILLDSLPLLPNGKLDRRALPKPEKTRLGSAGTYVAPRTPIEELLAGIWSDLLQVERVGVHDNFFDLGGHSLQGMRLMAKIQDAFGISLGVRALFESPTVAGIAVAIAEELMAGADAEVLAAALAELE